MKLSDKIKFCKTQFLYDDFIGDHCDDLKTLHSNACFMNLVHEISQNTREDLLFGVGGDSFKAASFKRFKDDFCELFYKKLKFSDYPAYKRIYYAVKDKGNSGKSATISVFYAMLYLDLINKEGISVESERQLILKRR